MSRIIGIDFGDKRIGVAMSDALELTAQRLVLLDRQGTPKDVEAIVGLVEEHGATALVVGLPLTMRGEQGPQAKKVVAFCDALRRRTTIPVHLLDERLTTAQGQRALLETDTSRRRRKALIDQVAAQLILQQFLDAKTR